MRVSAAASLPSPDPGGTADPDRRRHRAALLGLACGNALLSAWHLSVYARAAGGDLHAAARSYLALALAAELWALALAPSLLLLPLTRWRRARRVLPVMAPALHALVQAFLFVDGALFAILRCHFDGLALQVVTTPGGFASLGMDPAERLRLVAGAAALLAAEGGGYALLLRRARRAGVARRGARWRIAAAAAVCLLAGERVAYAAGAWLRDDGVLRAAAAVPSYEVERRARLRSERPGEVRLTLAPVRAHAPARRPNVVWIVVESWRADALDPELTPALWRFSRGAQVFHNHVSGGNWTYAGVFSMFYGLHASYGLSFEEARRGPLLFRRLLDLDYDVRVVASRGTRFPLFRETVFADVTGRVEDDLPGATSAEKDVALLERARAVLRGRDAGRPFFLGLFVDSTHLPYAFPPERAHYRPYSDHLYYTEMTSPLPREPIYNRYRNAVAWVDHVVGEVLRALDETGPADDTLVVITGDHGQEFYEHGVLGHNVTFSREQIRVPLLLRGPGLSPGDRLELTRHVDLAATLLDVLGVENDPAELGFGRSLLRAGEAPYAVSCGNARCALVEPDGTVAVFSTTTATPEYAFFDGEYRPLPPSAVSRAPHLGDVVQELRRFRR